MGALFLHFDNMHDPEQAADQIRAAAAEFLDQPDRPYVRAVWGLVEDWRTAELADGSTPASTAEAVSRLRAMGMQNALTMRLLTPSLEMVNVMGTVGAIPVLAWFGPKEWSA